MSIDLSTEYLGLNLKSPLVASASPCTGQPDVLRQMESCGVGAAVLPSLFEEQIVQESRTLEATSFSDEFPRMKEYNTGAENYASLVEQARQVVSMPIIGSLNGSAPGGWIEQVERIVNAGANALELNLHFVPTDPSISGQGVEAQYLDTVASVVQITKIPLAVKLGPYFSSLPHFARQVVEAGANGLVLFNRFLEPEVNLEKHSIDPHLELSHPSEARLSLRWVGILSDQLPGCSLAACGGIHSGKDALKALAVGAKVAMVTSALLKHGATHLESLRTEMIEWMSLHKYTTARQITGILSRKNSGASEAFERVNYAGTLASYMDHGACPE